MVCNGLFEGVALVDAVGFEVDDFSAVNGAVFVSMDDNAVKYTVHKLITFDVTESTLAPDGGLSRRFGEQGVNVRLGETVLQRLFDCIIWMLWQFGKPLDLFKGVVDECAKIRSSLFQFKMLGGWRPLGFLN